MRLGRPVGQPTRVSGVCVCRDCWDPERQILKDSQWGRTPGGRRRAVKLQALGRKGMDPREQLSPPEPSLVLPPRLLGNRAGDST